MRALLIVVALTGCKKSGPIAITWNGPQFDGDVSGMIELRNDALIVSRTDGARIEIGGEVVPLEGISPMRFLGEMRASEDRDIPQIPIVTLDTTMTITYEGRTGTSPVTSQIPMPFAPRLYDMFSTVSEGKPLVFTNDDSAGGEKSVMRVDDRNKEAKLYGPAVRVKQVDFVAREQYLDASRTKTCQYDRGPVDFKLHASKISMIDRRTGKVVATNEFPAEDIGCPYTLTSSSPTDYGASDSAIGMWLVKELGKH